MTKSLTEQARAMGRARQAMLTPEERTRNARELAARRWKGNGLTRDQQRSLRKLMRQDVAIIRVLDNPDGRRMARAVATLDGRGYLTVMASGPETITYRRGPQWAGALQALEKHRVKKST